MGSNFGTYEDVVKLLNEEGVGIEDMAVLVYDLQKPYVPNVTMEESCDSIKSVLSKREVINTVMVGLELDRSARNRRMENKTLEKILIGDQGLFGVDEVLAYTICNIYGSIALTNFGYLDKIKPGIIGVINNNHERCNVFLDDIIGAIVASAASRVAHRHDE
ncbi:MAG: phosphatidylglycerophosphatase A [Erysipelotrichales bacterium]|nr:phosphatidylglycerophosphatase A [Erysipelotrichales bacterium]